MNRHSPREAVMQRTLFTLIVLSICTTSLAADAPKVLVAPFVETGNRPAFPWVGRAIQRALVTELSETGEARPIAAGEHVKLGFDEKHLPAVIDAGKSEGAAYVVVGAFEVTDGQL